MIKVIKTGQYKLIETKDQNKILILDADKIFAWISLKDIGEILITSHKAHKADAILSVGRYRIYDVEDEPKLSDQLHLELSVGEGVWQGYLLTSGLPTDIKKRKRIIPTNEVITKSKGSCNCEDCCC
jgi:hypothetical protein